jgi:endonuclease/exonuclease/phosphatase family metal-dependent hydrolase
MSPNLRISTLNCENLFSRPKIFQSPRSEELLGYASDLNDELRKPAFDHARIEELKAKLEGYAKVEDIKGKHTSAPGAADWLGWVDLVRVRTDDMAIENTARVLADINADIQCLCEVEDRPLLKRFHDQMLVPLFLKPAGKAAYDHIILMDGNDDRGIDVALMSRHPIDWIRTHIDEKTVYEGQTVPLFSRDCLEVHIQLSFGPALTLLVNHLKSMGYSAGGDTLSNKRRYGQAKRVAEIAAGYDLATEHLAVIGDLNSPPDSWSLEPLIKNSHLYNVNLELPENDRGTYQGRKQQIDYILVSDALKARLGGVSIERRGAFSKSAWQPYPTVTSPSTAASDHCAVVADFTL